MVIYRGRTYHVMNLRLIHARRLTITHSRTYRVIDPHAGLSLHALHVAAILTWNILALEENCIFEYLALSAYPFPSMHQSIGVMAFYDRKPTIWTSKRSVGPCVGHVTFLEQSRSVGPLHWTLNVLDWSRSVGALRWTRDAFGPK